MSSLQLAVLFVFAIASGTWAQQCQPSTGILKLSGMDENCQQLHTIQECTQKMQLTVSQLCMAQLQPDLPVSQDGSFCSPSKGVQARGLAGGKLVIGRSDLDFVMRPHEAAGVVVMNLKGRFVPPTGGREYPVDCNMMFNVTGGSALGIVSAGTDTLMSTTVQPSLAGGGYSGAALPGQQNGMNGGLNGALNPQAESGNQQNQPAKKSSAGSVLSGSAGRILACMAGVLGLLLPAML